MSLRALDPQFALVCDWCGEACEYESMTIHVEADRVTETARDWSWRVIDEKHMCSRCAEERGANPDDPDDIPWPEGDSQ